MGKEVKIGWCIIPPTVMGDELLSLIEKVVYGRVLGLADKFGYCSASNAYLGKQIGKSAQTISKTLSSLSEKGWVIVDVVRDDETKQVKERKVYPQFLPEGYGKKQGEGVSLEKKGGMVQNEAESIEMSTENKREDIVAPEAVAGKDINLLIDKFKEINPSYQRLFANKAQRAALERVVKSYGKEKVEGILDMLPWSNQQAYAPVVTTPIELEHKIAKVVYFLKREKDKKEGEKKAVRI